MLTIPKLSNHNRLKNQDQFFIINDNINTQKNLSLTTKNIQSQKRINNDNSIKNKQNISKIISMKTNDKLLLNTINNLQQISLNLNINSINNNNKINNKLRPISNLQNISNFSYQNNKNNLFLNQTAKMKNICFSPKYQKQRQKNHNLLMSLKLENQKYKKLFLQDNQQIFKKQQNTKISQFHIQYFNQKQQNKNQEVQNKKFQNFTYIKNKIIYNNNKTNLNSNKLNTHEKINNFDESTFNNIMNKAFDNRVFLTQPRKALQQMTHMTSSFIVDDNEYNQNNIQISKFSNNMNSLNPSIHQKIDQQQFNSFKNTPKQIPIKQPSVNDFHKLKYLGKGNFGQVHLVIHKQTRFICAMKTIKKQLILQQKIIHQITKQIKIHLSLKHLNIISFYGFFNDKQNMYILTQYATGGQLYQKLKQNYRMQQSKVIPIVKNVLDGLKIIHSLGYIHRDIKPENVIFQFGIAKICDLGWATECGYNQTRNSFCGTPLYLSPEMIKKQNYDQNIDIWALGILCYQLIVGKVPFNIWSQFDLQQIVQKQIVFPTSYVDMSEKSMDFIRKCLMKNQYERVKVEKLYNHEFIQENIQNAYFNVEVYDTVEKLFQ